MKEVKKRSLFNKIFGTKQGTKYNTATQLELLNGYQAMFTNYNGKLYDSSQVRACIDAIARNGAKLNPKHIRSNDKSYQSMYDSLKRLISEQPNEIMNAYDFYYKIISLLYLYNNAFIYILRDENDAIVGLYPINANKYELLEYNKNIYIKFSFNKSNTYVASLKDDIIHLKRFFCENDLTGGNITPITKTMSFKHIIQEGVINSIKTTQGIKGILKTTKAMLKPEDIKATRDQFVKDFMESNDDSGIAGLDATTDFKPVDINPRTASDEQVKEINDEILNYFGISREIIQSTYTEQQWNAFYESVIEPIGIMLGLEFTNKIFTVGERYHGNKIVFEANRLQYASNQTKISIAEKMNNYMTINEIREMFNLAPVENGDKIMQDLNHIDNSIANEYQVGVKKEDIVVEEGEENE